MESDTPFISKFHMFVFTVQLFFLPPLFSSYVVKWLKPFYNIAHVKATKRQKKKTKKKRGKKFQHPQRETKGFKLHRAPPSVQARIGGRWAALHSLAQLSQS